jgi:hypothetical protein
MRILFSIVSVTHIPEKQIKICLKSAKKYFLVNHDVDYVIFTDLETPPKDIGARYIKIDNSFSDKKTYYQFQKLLHLNYIDFNQYDYIFVCDYDSWFINEITDEDLLTNELCILQHFGRIKIKPLINLWTDVIQIDDDNLGHTMGNFFGGPSHLINQLKDFTNEIWDKYKNHYFKDYGFFSYHSEEVVLVSFVDKQKPPHRFLSSSFEYNQSAFITDFHANGDLLKNYKGFKLIHDTKYLLNILELSDKLFEDIF